MKPIKEKDVYYHYSFEEILSDIICELRENVPEFDEQDVFRAEELEYDKDKDYIKGYSDMSYRFTEDKYSLVKNAFMSSLERNKDNIVECKGHIIGVDSQNEELESKYFKKYKDGYEFYFGLEVHKGDKDRMLREKISDVERAVPTDPMEAYRKERLEERKYGRRHY